MLHAHDNIEMDTTHEHVINSLKYARHADTFQTRHNFMIEVLVLHRLQRIVLKSQWNQQASNPWLNEQHHGHPTKNTCTCHGLTFNWAFKIDLNFAEFGGQQKLDVVVENCQKDDKCWFKLQTNN